MQGADEPMARPAYVSENPTPLADARHLAALLPDGVQLALAEPRHERIELHPLERAYLNGRAMLPVREREFCLGRALARETLTRFGISDHPLIPADTREPQWPAAIVGSISHCEDICAVAVAGDRHLSGLGIDLERIGRIDGGIASTICTPDELNEGNDPRRMSVLFSAKESIFKTVFPSTRHFLDFRDVSVVIAGDRFSARPARSGLPMQIEALHGRFYLGQFLVVTAAWLT
ncbi:MAG TPA: 4'-phosphopantetheinyl transferase superfamily protein [Rudaea sp.]|jgi:4'-phosphopantetheinyl transferase EntD|nr:4'-phosphopantetheinyl transferase superfamily protein [Rudaea sp.]